MVRLIPWERGFAVEAPHQKGVRLYFWFYEWNMFDALSEGEHTSGRHDFPWVVSDDRASTESAGISVTAHAMDDGAALTLTITNESGHDWPDGAGVIPCFSPGHPGVVPQSARFVDDDHTRTYFLGQDGLELLRQREIHFNERLRPWLDRLSPDGRFVFSGKWPTSDRNAVGGLIVREATDARWVTGIAWEDYLSAQGHNPWDCMHVCIRVGPLARDCTKAVRGRIYLFEGTKENVLARCREDGLV